jgi:hypothetical protein
VEVVVGCEHNQTTHYLPPSALTTNSGYFRGCLSGSFKESLDNKIILEDASPHKFAFFVQWLWQGKIWSKDDIDNMAIRQGGGLIQADMIAVWFLADRFVAEGLQNHCIDSLRCLLGRCTSEARILGIICELGAGQTE